MKRYALTLAGLALALAAQAQVSVKEPWVRATVAQQKATGAFMQLRSEKDSRVVSASSPVAAVVEIHEMAMDKDVMMMRALPQGLPLPAGKTIELKPGGYHLMLLDLKGQIKEGDKVPLTLQVENKDGKRSQLEVSAEARPLTGMPAKSH